MVTIGALFAALQSRKWLQIGNISGGTASHCLRRRYSVSHHSNGS